MTGHLYGYMRVSLAGRRRFEIEDQFRWAAAGLGGRLVRVFAEPDSAVEVLWSLLSAWDRSSGDGRVVPALLDFATRAGVDVERLIDEQPARQWDAMVAELASRGGGCILIPSRQHLGLSDGAGSALLQRLSRAEPSITVVFLSDPRPTSPGPPRVGTNDRGAVGSVLVGEFAIKAFGSALEVALLKTWWHLTHSGLSDLVGRAEAIVRALIEDRIAPHPPEDPGSVNALRVRLLRTMHTLVIDIHETENHVREPIPAVVRHYCVRTQRLESVTAGTVTWCELPLTGPRTTVAARAGSSAAAPVPAAGGGRWP